MNEFCLILADAANNRWLEFNQPPEHWVGELSIPDGPVNNLRSNPFDLSKIDEWLANGYYVAGWLSFEALNGELLPAPNNSQIYHGFIGAFRNANFLGDWDSFLPLNDDELSGQKKNDGSSEVAGKISSKHDVIQNNSGILPSDRVTEVLNQGKYGHLENIKTALSEIQNGTFYQLNLTTQFLGEYKLDPYELWLSWITKSQPPYGSYLKINDSHALSCSPELGFSIDGDFCITAKPIKGTVSAADCSHYQEAIKYFSGSEKDRAENLMIVDLWRNDLSRICKHGTINVTDLWKTIRLPELYHLESTITGSLLENLSVEYLFNSIYPYGSVVGTPKLKALEWINHLEKNKRELYCGSSGYFIPPQIMNSSNNFNSIGSCISRWNVAIRTAKCTRGIYSYGTGSAIVADSDPGKEYQEWLVKYNLFADLATNY